MNAPLEVMTSAEIDALEYCEFCKKPIAGEPLLSDMNIFDEPFCSSSCIENWEQARNERLHENELGEFYGG